MSGHAYDAVIIGGGHNGLVCAWYLARRGLKVAVFERRHVLGGAAVTEEFVPGFRNSTASYTVSLLNPKIIRDMDLARHGLRIVERRLANFLPTEDGRALVMGGAETEASIAQFAPGDVARFADYSQRLEVIADLLRALILTVPPNRTEGTLSGLGELMRAAELGHRLSGLDLEAQRDLLTLFTRSAGEWLDDTFEAEPLKAVLGFDAVVGNFASPYTPGSAYVLLHHVFGEVNGRKGAWGHAIGGMGAITTAMAAACAEAGVQLFTDSAVREVLSEKGRATGIVLEDGRRFRARCVVANVHPRLLFEKLVDPAVVPEAFSARMRQHKSGSGTFRMNVALSALPRFTARPEGTDHLTAGIIIAPSLAYMDRAWREAWEQGWSSQPIVEMLIPSTLDDSLAPEGAHVASLFCQHVRPDLGRPDLGRDTNGVSADWPQTRETIARLMIETVDRHAPGFAASVVGQMALGPVDLEERFGLVDGDIFHGRLSLDQLFSARPVLGHADHRMVLPGLYLCGSGAHPGGGVTGAPGHNAAGVILKDFRARRL